MVTEEIQPEKSKPTEVPIKVPQVIQAIPIQMSLQLQSEQKLNTSKPDKGKGIVFDDTYIQDSAYVSFIDECFNKTVVVEEFCGVIGHYVDTVESSSVIVEQKIDYVEKEQGKMDFLDKTYEEKKKEI
ncbi:hypothetical protein Tco_0396800 [Tanacetum coccineum]